MNPIEEQLGELHRKEPPKVERRGPAKLVDCHKACARNHVDSILKDRVLGGRFNRWTDDQKARLHNIAEQYQSLAIRMMEGEDISEELYEVFVKARALTGEQSTFTGIDAVKEILIRWLGSVHTSLFPE